MGAWAILGIAPTADVAAIRRAYARKLKLTRPDEDPDGFQCLVRARDAALGEAAAIADPSPSDEAEVEEEEKHEIAPVLATAHHIDTERANPRDAAAPETDEAAIVIREVSEPEAPSVSAAPIPRIVITDGNGGAVLDSSPAPHQDGFSLEVSERHWFLGRQMAALARRLISTVAAPDEELAHLIQASATLPRGPRQEVEASFIEAVGRGLRLPNGRLNRVRVEQVRTLFTRGEAVFGWLRDDRLIHRILGPRDAAAFCLIGQEEDDWKSDRRPRLPDSDARALFADTRRYMRAYERFRRRGRPAWRFDFLAFLAPTLWAYYYHQTSVAFATLALLTTAGVLMLDADALGDARNLAAAGIFLATCLGTALFADRFILWGAARTVRRARNELLYDPKARADFLRREGYQPREFMTFLIFVLFSLFFLTIPYVGAYVRLEQVVAALAARIGW